MAIEDALQLIEQSWDEIEPLFTVRELAAIASIGLPPINFPEEGEPASAVEAAEAIFEVMAAALPPEHAAWSALISSRTRFAPGIQRPPTEEIVSRCIFRAWAASARPSMTDDAAADCLVEATERQLLRHGVVAEVEVPKDRPLIAVEIDGLLVYPQVQFVATDPLAVHDLVWLLNERLGGQEDQLGAISWWLTPNTWLGRAPADLLGAGRDAEIAYAADHSWSWARSSRYSPP
jgi:hypothetical protein